MKILIVALVGLVFAAAAASGLSAQNPAAKQTGAKPAPACAALVFRPLPAGSADGEQLAGTYKSRFARLELRGTVQNGAPVTYYLMASGNRVVAVPKLPQAAGDCAAAKKLPRPGRRRTPALASGSPPFWSISATSAWRFSTGSTVVRGRTAMPEVFELPLVADRLCRDGSRECCAIGIAGRRCN